MTLGHESARTRGRERKPARGVSVAIGLRMAMARLGRRFSVVTAVLSTGGVALAATLERRSAPVRAADHTLIGAVFGIALPLIAYFAVSQVTRRRALDEAVGAVARYGLDRRGALLGLMIGLSMAVALLGGWLALLGVVVARGAFDLASLSDAFVSAKIALMGAVTYVALFCLGASLRWVSLGMFAILAADWVLGSTQSAAGALFPRSHLKNLLGTEPVMGMAQWQAFAALYALSLLCVSTVLSKARR